MAKTTYPNEISNNACNLIITTASSVFTHTTSIFFLVRPSSMMSKVKSEKSLFRLSPNTFDNFLKTFAKTLYYSVKSARKIKSQKSHWVMGRS